jgi:hypothetical protein
VYSKPASISIFRRIGCISVCQSISFFANGLPFLQNGPYHGLPSVQDELYHGLPNVQDEPFHGLPSMQDEHYPPGYRPLVVFSKKINACHANMHIHSDQVLLTNHVHFIQYPPMQFLHILSQRVSRCSLLCTRYLEPFLCLLVRVFSNVYAILEHAYVSTEKQHHAAILVRIESMQFFQRAHDFVALWQRTGQILLRIPYSTLYNLSRNRFSYLCTRASITRGVRMQSFFVVHRRPILSYRVLSSCSPLFSTTVTLPSKRHIGGGSSRLPCGSVLPYIVSKPSTLNDRSYLHYVAYVDDVGLISLFMPIYPFQ